MTKTDKLQAISATQATTVTTVTTEVTTTTTTKYGPTCYMPIDDNDEGSRKFYRDNGIPVVTINRYGKNKLFALVAPDEGMKSLAEDEGKSIEEVTDAFSRAIDNDRRTTERRTFKVRTHEVASLETMLAAGYDPTGDSTNVELTINTNCEVSSETTDAEVTNTSEDITAPSGSESNADEDYGFTKKTVSKGGYDSYSDDNNPENIHTRKVFLEELREAIDGLDGEKSEIIDMIKQGKSDRQMAAELGMPQRTLSRHRAKLMDELRELLKDYYI
jgi:DNA-directed RNA polymerase specialized sigma24 family protein